MIRSLGRIRSTVTSLAIAIYRPEKAYLSILATAFALLASAVPAAAKTPNLDGSWQLQYGDRILEVAIWLTEPKRESENRYAAMILDEDRDCVTVSTVRHLQYIEGPKAWMRLPKGTRSPSRPHSVSIVKGVPLSPNINKETEFSERFSNNCNLEANGGLKDTSNLEQFSAQLYWVGAGRWEGQVKAASPGQTFADRSEWPSFKAVLRISPMSSRMRASVTDSSIYTSGVHPSSVFAGLRQSVKEVRQANYDQQVRENARTRQKAATIQGYLQAIMENDRRTIGMADRRFAKPLAAATGSRRTDAYRNLERLLAGRGFASEAQHQAMRDFFEKTSLLAAVNVTYLFDYERQFPNCRESMKTLEIPWQLIETTRYPDGRSSDREVSSGVARHTVPERLFDRLVRVARVEPYAGSFEDNILGALVYDPERITITQAVSGTSAWMSNMKCRSAEQAQFERNLFALYDAYWRDQESRLKIFYAP